MSSEARFSICGILEELRERLSLPTCAPASVYLPTGACLHAYVCLPACMHACLTLFQGRWLSSESQLLQAGETAHNPTLVLLVRGQSPCKEVACPKLVCLPGPLLQDPEGLTCRRSPCSHMPWDRSAPWGLILSFRHFLPSQRGKTQERRP